MKHCPLSSSLRFLTSILRSNLDDLLSARIDESKSEVFEVNHKSSFLSFKITNVARLYTLKV